MRAIEWKPQESRIAVGYIHLLCNFMPLRVRFGMELASGRHGELEVFLGYRIGVRVVAYPDVRFLHRYDIRDFISLAFGFVLDAAHPKVGRITDQGPRIIC